MITVKYGMDRYVSVMRFIGVHRRIPDPKRRLYNDYLHGLKVSGALEDPLRVFVSDKEYCKLFIRAVVGEQYVVPTYAILRSEADVREFEFPSRCAIKGTHGSGQYLIRRDGENIDLDKIISWLSIDFFRISAERNYRNLTPKIIVEPLAAFHSDITELFIHCYRGEPKIVRVIKNRLTFPHRNVFDCQWQATGIAYLGFNTDSDIPKPANLAEILAAVRKIAVHFESIRVDCYLMGDQFWIGELTNCQSSALLKFENPGDEERFSEMYFSPTAVSPN